MKSIAIVACCDTKYHEIRYMADFIRNAGHRPLVVDISTGPNVAFKADITREEVLREGGWEWADVHRLPKSEAIAAMSASVTRVVGRLQKEKIVDAALGMGGLQNTVVSSAAFRRLPIGFPKLIVSTIASGYRHFETVVGDRDITVVPSVVDFTGINPLSESILGNAAAAIIGMAERGNGEINTAGRNLIAATLMGITNDTVMRAMDALRALGKETISFHSTGMGGRVMEEMIRDGHIRAVMDLTLHEMTAEYFGGYGYSKGADNRLTAAAEMGVPMLVCPGGIDFACLRKDELFDDEEARGYVWHNADLTHTRLYEKEILDITGTIIRRVNASRGPVTVLLPLGGLRTLCQEGEPFHKPETIRRMDAMFRQGLKQEIRYVSSPYAFIDTAFADLIVQETLKLLEGV